MSKKELLIPFKLVHIEEKQFSVFEDVLEVEDSIQQKISFGFGVNFSDFIIAVSFQYLLIKMKQPLLKTEISCHFQVEKKTFRNSFAKG